MMLTYFMKSGSGPNFVKALQPRFSFSFHSLQMVEICCSEASSLFFSLSKLRSSDRRLAENPKIETFTKLAN